MKETFRVVVDSSEYTFSGAHFLVFGAGEATEPLHGHDYRVKVEVVGPVDPLTGWVVDFLELQAILLQNVRPLDQKILLPKLSPYLKIDQQDGSIDIKAPDRSWSLPTTDCLILPIQATTTELIARHLALTIHGDLVARCSASFESLEVTLEESGGFRASCRLEDAD